MPSREELLGTAVGNALVLSTTSGVSGESREASGNNAVSNAVSTTTTATDTAGLSAISSEETLTSTSTSDTA